jgi:hypothetical protein
MKTGSISVIKKHKYMKGKINELTMNSKNEITLETYLEEYIHLRGAINLEVT